MVEVGVRELKSRLSHYLGLMQEGEMIAIKVRHRLVGFISNLRPETAQVSRSRRLQPRDLQRKIAQWKKEGVLLSGGLCRPHPFKPIPLKGRKTSTELLREMRDEE